jgi:hypothetical protein
VLGFWVACLYFLAFDFFSIAILFAVDASNVINIDQELHVNHGVYKGKQYTLGRRLKAASNPLSYVYEYEILASIVAFILSYFYLIMGLNLYRYKADMMHDCEFFIVISLSLFLVNIDVCFWGFQGKPRD